MKTIFSEDGRKVNGNYPNAKAVFGIVDENNEVTVVSFKDWVKSPEIDQSSEYIKKEVVAAALKSIPFNKRVDFNQFCRQNEPNFIEKLQKLEGFGVKITKKGIKFN